MPAGQAASVILHQGGASPLTRDLIKAGNYVITWAGGCTVDVTGTGISSLSVGANRTTFTLAQVPTFTQLTLRVRNLTGANQDATSIKLFHADHETANEVSD